MFSPFLINRTGERAGSQPSSPFHIAFVIDAVLQNGFEISELGAIRTANVAVQNVVVVISDDFQQLLAGTVADKTLTVRLKQEVYDLEADLFLGEKPFGLSIEGIIGLPAFLIAHGKSLPEDVFQLAVVGCPRVADKV
jgi:hypothetical protein